MISAACVQPLQHPAESLLMTPSAASRISRSESCSNMLKSLPAVDGSKSISLLPRPALPPSHTHTDTHTRGARWEEPGTADKSGVPTYHIPPTMPCGTPAFRRRQQKRPRSQPRERVAPHASALMRLFIVAQLFYLHPPALHLSPYQTHQIGCLSASPAVIRQASAESQNAAVNQRRREKGIFFFF